MSKKILVIGVGNVGIVTAYKLMQKNKSPIYIYDNSKKKIELLKKQKVIISENLKWQFFYKNIILLSNIENINFDLIFICISANYINKEKTYQLDNILRLIKISKSKIYVIRSTAGLELIKNKNKLKNFVYWPEFMREGKALHDFEKDEFLIYSKKAKNLLILSKLFKKEYKFVELNNLILIKIISNAFRAIKVSIANEIGLILKLNNVDVKNFYNIFIKLRGNGDDRYLLPGDPYGGYCLPKELKYVSNLNLRLPIFQNTKKSNDHIIKKLYKKILDSNWKKIIFFTLNFKKNVEDMRDSPFYIVAKKLSKHKKVYTFEKIQKFYKFDPKILYDCLVVPNYLINKKALKNIKFKNKISF